MTDAENRGGGTVPDPTGSDAGDAVAPDRQPVDFVEGADDGEWGDDDYDAYDYDYDYEGTARWAAVFTTLGVGLVVVVGVQVVLALAQGLSIDEAGNDFFHRVGSAFGPPGAILALLMLLIAVVLYSLPMFLGEMPTEPQRRILDLAFAGIVVLGTITALGSVLWVRAILHALDTEQAPVPSYLKLSYVSFLVTSLALAAAAIWAAVVTRKLRDPAPVP